MTPATRAPRFAPDASQVQHDRYTALPPRLEVQPGNTVGFDMRDKADLHYTTGDRRRHKPPSQRLAPPGTAVTRDVVAGAGPRSRSEGGGDTAAR